MGSRGERTEKTGEPGRSVRRLRVGIGLGTVGIAAALAAACVRETSMASAAPGPAQTATTARGGAPRTEKEDRIVKSDEEWRKLLTPEQFNVLREKGTERAFTGAYWNEHRKGTYVCAACGKPLFSADQKFDSGTGWPSFWASVAPGSVSEHSDHSFGMDRTEVVCSRCGGHLGHLFDDGPKPTGMRYCINSAALKFEPSEK